MMDSNSMIVFAVVWFAAFTQSLTGFGSGLITMAFLPAVIGIRSAAPLVALFAGTLESTLFLRYRASVNVSAIWRLLAAAMVGIPLGILGVRGIDERIVLTILGIVLVGYPMYALLMPPLPPVKEGKLTFGVGFVAGLLGGAYNTSGPPVIIYAHSRGWSPQEFKANLQGFFLLNDVMTITGHAVSGNLTPFVWQNYVLILPAIVLGIVAGLVLDRFLSPALFRKIVLVLLMGLGVRMIGLAL
jgi:hypothetical protein